MSRGTEEKGIAARQTDSQTPQCVGKAVPLCKTWAVYTIFRAGSASLPIIPGQTQLSVRRSLTAEGQCGLGNQGPFLSLETLI